MPVLLLSALGQLSGTGKMANSTGTWEKNRKEQLTFQTLAPVLENILITSLLVRGRKRLPSEVKLFYTA